MFCLFIASQLLTMALIVDTPSDLPIFEDEVFVVGEGPLVEAVAKGEKVTVRFGAGELDISVGDTLEVRAEIEVRCPPARKKRCGNVRRRLRVEPKRTAEGLEIRMSGVRMSLLRRLDITGKVVVPRDSPLHVRAGAGDVDIEAGNRSLTVQMLAGDLTIRGARNNFSEARVRTRIGDALVRVGGRVVSSRRSKLIGAKADWQTGGPGEAITVRLRFGSAQVVLEDTGVVANLIAQE